MLLVLMDETHHILLNNDRIGYFIVKEQDRVRPSEKFSCLAFIPGKSKLFSSK